MSLKIDRVQLEIIIQQDEARQKMIELENSMRKARAELGKIKKQFGENSDEYKAQEQVVKDLKIKYDKLFEGIGIGKLSLKELTNRQRELNAILRNLDPSLPEWKEYNKQLQEINVRIKELKGTANVTRFSLSKMADGFNKYAAMGASVVATLTGVALTARKCVDEYAEMEEAEAQVIKYTGMTKNEVKELNEEFKQMDTRTAREKLNALAGDAGRLGITGKQNVLEFVDAADKINVALGEDLGEDAVKNIGKLAQMFGEDEKLGLRGAMLSTGSAINEVAQNSSAAEAYLVGFTARVAGAANQAKVAQGDILGYASVLDQNMQQQEMAATAFQTLMMKMYQEPAKFAKIAGQSVEDFASLIKKDANEAILQFLDTLHKKGGLDQLAPMFKEMGLDGVRASGVISTMAGKIDDIRTAQKLANDAYRDGTSIINEFNVQNNTVQAGLDKAKKAFKDVRVEMGEKLQPVMKYMITTGSLTVKGLSALISILYEYKGGISGAMVVVASWIALKKLVVAWTKLETLWNEKATLSFKNLKKAMASNIFGIILVGLGAYIGKLIEAHDKQDELKNSLSGMKKVNHEVAQSFAEQESKVRALTSIINDNGVALHERRKALDELKEIIPGYNAQLTDEGTLINDNTESLKDYLVQLEKEIKLKAAKEELEELYKKKRNLETTEGEQSDQYWNIKQQNTLSGYNRNGFTAKVSRFFGTEKETNALNQLNETRDALQDVANKIEEINDEIARTSIEVEKVEDNTGKKGGNGGGAGGEDKCLACGNKPCTCGNDVDKAIKAREDALKQAMQEERNLWKEEYLNHQHTEDEYQQALYDSEMMFLLKKKALLESYDKDTSAIQGQIYDKMIAEANRLANVRKKTEAEEKAAYFSALELKYQEDLQSLKKQYLEGDIKTEKEYQAKMKRLELDYLNERKRMQEEYGDDVLRINGQILDKELKLFQDAKRKKEKLEEKKKEDVKDDFYTRTDDPAVNVVIDGLQLIFATKKQMWETEEEYEERIKGNKLKGIQLVAQATALASAGIQALQEHEINKITRKYDKEIKAAQKAGKDTTKLEEEKEEAINQVKKKYADKQFAAAVLQVTASTAVAAMEAYKAMAGIPIVGPALGAIAAAAAVASGAAQIAVAKQQRDEAKGLKSGGYSDEYVEGYTDNGNPDDVAGVIPVHKNEFVTNHEGVANPHVRQFLDVFDVAQKNGTIRMINTTQILEQVRTHSGKYSGGYTEDVSPSRSFVGNPTEWTPELRSQIVELLQQNNELLAAIRDKDLIVDPRKVRDGIKRVEFLEKNISR